MKKARLILAILSSFYIGRAQQPSQPTILRIDPSTAMGGTVSQLIDSVEFIPLESTPQSAFGRIDQLEITKNYYLILDRETTSLLIFTSNGRFHARIEGAKINPQHPNFYNFSFDREKEEIEIHYLYTILRFNLDGKLLSKAQGNPSSFVGTKLNLGKGYDASYLYNPWVPSSMSDSIAFQLMSSQQGHVIQHELPYHLNLKYDDTQGAQSHMDLTAGDTDTSAYYVRDYDYAVYKLTPHTFKKAFSILLPLQNSLPADFLTNPDYNDRRAKYVSEHKDVIYKINDFYHYGDKICFKAISGNPECYTYLYNTSTGMLLCVNKIVSDARSYYLPVTDGEIGGPELSYQGLLQFDGGSFYTSYTSLILFYMRQNTQSKGARYPPALAAYFADQANKKGNPVLVRFKFKPNLCIIYR